MIVVESVRRPPTPLADPYPRWRFAAPLWLPEYERATLPHPHNVGGLSKPVPTLLVHWATVDARHEAPPEPQTGDVILWDLRAPTQFILTDISKATLDSFDGYWRNTYATLPKKSRRARVRRKT